MPDVTCRPAVESDLPEVRRLACGMSREPVTPADEAFAARFRHILARDDWALLVAGDGARLAGYALVQDYGSGLRRDLSTARLHDIYVDEAARRRGVGRALMDAVTAWCRGRGVPMILDWQSRPDATGFYDALGLVGDPVGDNAAYPAYSIDFRP